MISIPNTIRRLSSVDGGAVLDLRRGVMFRLNNLGARVLDLLAQGDSTPEIAKKLSAEFDVPLSQTENDVSEFVASLKARGVIDVR
jgi:Coenzyme PQQ synthesis protein D (PqqD)